MTAHGVSPELQTTARGRAGEGAPDLPARLEALRAELKRQGLHGFFIPHADEYQGEYLPACAERLAYATGFTGSAGAAVVMLDAAAIFVDGRYTLQVRSQVDVTAFETLHLIEQPPLAWLAEKLKRGMRFGIDSRLHTVDEVERLRQVCAKAEAELVRCEHNPVDATWVGRPAEPMGQVVPHGEAFTGEAPVGKRARMARAVRESGAGAAVLTLTDSVAWLFNLRGADVPCTPVALAYAILSADGTAELFIAPGKVHESLPGHLGEGVRLRPPAELAGALDSLGQRRAKVRLDNMTAPAWFYERLQAAGATVLRLPDPVLLPKACKNAVELEGARRAHVRDGAALTRFLAWVAREAPAGRLTEMDAAAKLAQLRADNEYYRGPSFESISGAGANGAIVHYKSSPATNRALQLGELYLIDSGGQYLDGTTDVTRTVAVGSPPAAQRRHFTLVLRGHIALATARFPRGTTGAQLDVLARRALWDAGLDYDHGTGHGVGSYLGVHEGPQRIAKLPNTVALEPGMIVSDEPGYYRAGHYGIRIENLVAVTPASAIPGGEREMLGFEVLTVAPIDRNLVDASLLTADERQWLNAYHERVRTVLTPLLDATTAQWLAEAAAPV